MKGKRAPYKKREGPTGSISISEASRQFNIPKPTISRWKKHGYISVVEETNREIFISCKELKALINKYMENPGQGRWTARHYMYQDVE